MITSLLLREYEKRHSAHNELYHHEWIPPKSAPWVLKSEKQLTGFHTVTCFECKSHVTAWEIKPKPEPPKPPVPYAEEQFEKGKRLTCEHCGNTQFQLKEGSYSVFGLCMACGKYQSIYEE